MATLGRRDGDGSEAVPGQPRTVISLPTPAERGRASGLPTPPTALVGRKAECAALVDLLGGDVRLLTLVGPGGVGKSRLAVEAAGRLAGAFADGVVFVALAPVVDPALVAAAVGAALVVEPRPGRSVAEGLTERLRRAELLLVVDNLEHVIAAAPLLTDLLGACPGLRVLATSRVRLRLGGERVFPVVPLASPDQASERGVDDLLGYDAVRLFVARARDVVPSFALTPANGAAVAEICARLDGLPLALELAAARTRVLAPAALLHRLGGRLELLSGGPRDAPARHQELRRAMAWSYDLLAPGEQALFRRLAVCGEGFRLALGSTVGRLREAALRPMVARDEEEAAFLGQIEALLDASLLRRLEGEGGADPEEHWFGMLATVAQFGREQLAAAGEEEAARLAHAGACLEFAEQAAPGVLGPAPEPWLARLDREHHNLRAALVWATAAGGARGDGGVEAGGLAAAARPMRAELGLRLAGTLWRYWRHRGHWSEGRRWLEAALAGDDGSAPLCRAVALNGAGVFADDQGDYGVAEARYGEALALFRAAGDRAGAAGALSNLADIARVLGQYDLAAARYREALALRREVGDPFWVSVLLNNLGVLAWDQGQIDAADRWHREALAIARAIGHRLQTADVLNNLGAVAQARRDHARAGAIAAECLDLYRSLGHTRGVAIACYNVGVVALQQGDLGRAAAAIGECVRLNRELGDRLWLSRAVQAMGGVAVAVGRGRSAAMLGGAATALREAAGVPLSAHEASAEDEETAAVRKLLAADELAAAWAGGRSLSEAEILREVASVGAAADAVGAGMGRPGQAPTRRLATAPDLGLTPREQEVLAHLVAGRTDKEIAAALGLAATTASKHVSAILGKFGVKSRGAAVAAANRVGLM